MKLYDPLYSGKASGRHAGGVFSFSRGLAIFKKYTIPHQPNSPEQQAVKNRFSYLTKYWASSLTYEQITLWNEWSLPWTDIYGNTVLLTGINKFCIINDTLLKCGRLIQPTPPTLTPSTLVIANTGNITEINLVVTQPTTEEFTTQEPFLFVEVCGGAPYDDSEWPYVMNILTPGIPISRRPLEKNYSFVGPWTEQDTITNPSGEAIISYPSQPTNRLVSIRATRINKQGFWSNTVTIANEIQAA